MFFTGSKGVGNTSCVYTNAIKICFVAGSNPGCFFWRYDNVWNFIRWCNLFV